MLDVFQTIADPARRKMLHLLRRQSMTISALAENFSMSRPAVSKHIKILSSSGFIAVHGIGRERHCILRRDGFIELETWINYFDDFWKEKLQNLEMLLNRRKDGTQ